MFLKIVLSNINIKNTWKTLSTNIFIIQCDNIYNKLHSDLTNPPISFKHKQFFSPWKNGESNKTGNKIQISIDKHPMKSAPGKEEIIFLIDLSIEISRKKKASKETCNRGNVAAFNHRSITYSRLNPRSSREKQTNLTPRSWKLGGGEGRGWNEQWKEGWKT